jgi:hypothetical protein
MSTRPQPCLPPSLFKPFMIHSGESGAWLSALNFTSPVKAISLQHRADLVVADRGRDALFECDLDVSALSGASLG